MKLVLLHYTTIRSQKYFYARTHISFFIDDDDDDDDGDNGGGTSIMCSWTIGQISSWIYLEYATSCTVQRNEQKLMRKAAFRVRVVRG